MPEPSHTAVKLYLLQRQSVTKDVCPPASQIPFISIHYGCLWKKHLEFLEICIRVFRIVLVFTASSISRLYRNVWHEN